MILSNQVSWGIVNMTIAAACLLPACGGSPEASTEALTTDVAEEALLVSCAPSVDAAIAVPAGNQLAFSFDATGVQIYTCQTTATGYAWAFQAPEATLFDARGRNVGSHYAGPTWQYKDGSQVVGTKVAAVTPDATSIPWLLLQASSHTGQGKFAPVTYIQRLDTGGGLAPSAATCGASNVGEIARVDYVATYYFFKAGRPPCHCR
jgi:Protein of unknown function (DUF3455)